MSVPDSSIVEFPPTLTLFERRAGAAILRREKLRIATVSTRELLLQRPEWVARFGEGAAKRCAEDTAYHVEFLAGALEAGEPAAFGEYVGWLIDVLSARGIDGGAIADTLDSLGREVAHVTAGATRDVLAQLVQAGIARANAAGAAVVSGEPAQPLASAAAMFLRALLQGERKGALGVARAALRVAAHPADVYVDVFQASLVNIGRLWQLNKITVAQEHMATAIVQFVLAQLYGSMDRTGPSRGTALVTGVEGELHQVGANLVADVLEMDGWNVRFLGTNMPHDGIVDAAMAMKVDLLAISATMLFNIDPVARLVDEVRTRCISIAPRILVGGGAFRSAPHLWSEIGADGYAPDVRGACTVARGEVAA